MNGNAGSVIAKLSELLKQSKDPKACGFQQQDTNLKV